MGIPVCGVFYPGQALFEAILLQLLLAELQEGTYQPQLLRGRSCRPGKKDSRSEEASFGQSFSCTDKLGPACMGVSSKMEKVQPL